MPQSFFRTSLEDPFRQHIFWYRQHEPKHDIVLLSYVGHDYTLEFHISALQENKIWDDEKSSYMLTVVLRNPINGGGNMYHGYRGMRHLFHAMEEEARSPPGSDLQLSFLYTFPRTVIRHVDQGFGHIFLMEDESAIIIALIPHEKSRVTFNHGESVSMVFSRSETPPRIYMGLQAFIAGVERDNIERPNFYGNHA